MDKTQVLALLDARGISYELAEHEAVFHMGALAEAGVPHLDRIAKNLLLRDDKKRAFFLVSVWGEKRLDLKAFRKAHGHAAAHLRVRRGSVASARAHAWAASRRWDS